MTTTTNASPIADIDDSQYQPGASFEVSDEEQAEHDAEDEEDMDIVVVSPELSRDTMSDEEYAAECQRLENCYTALETETRYSVLVRPARSGEAPGTYYRTRSGLQILGYSLEIPEDLQDLSDAAWEKFCTLSGEVL